MKQKKTRPRQVLPNPPFPTNHSNVEVSRKLWMPCRKVQRKDTKLCKVFHKKFNLRIKLISNKKQGRPENELSPEETKWLIEFMDRPDITYTNPGKKDQRYVGKENGKSKFVPI